SALDTYRRAVLFDPRNVENHYELGLAALHFGEPEEAALHLGHVLRIHPSHGGALREAIRLRFEDGDYAGVVALFESYLAAFRVYQIPIRAGDATLFAPVLVDGRTHAVRVPLPQAEGTREIEARPDHPGLELLAVERVSRPAAGVAGLVRDTIRPEPPARAPWRVPLLAEPASTGALVLTLRARIPVDWETWERARTGYRNQLAFEALDAARSRVAVVGAPERPESAPLPEAAADAGAAPAGDAG
ncbi:MAG: hypothetical protein ACRELC_11345, partial [Gemmatimonadota bacterium]